MNPSFTGGVAENYPYLIAQCDDLLSVYEVNDVINSDHEHCPIFSRRRDAIKRIKRILEEDYGKVENRRDRG